MALSCRALHVVTLALALQQLIAAAAAARPTAHALHTTSSSAALVGRKLLGEHGSATQACKRNNGTLATYRIYVGDPNTGSSSSMRIGASDLNACDIPNEMKTNIYSVELSTLHTARPTLAVLAFNSRLPYFKPTDVSPSANPSVIYCKQLGGTSSTIQYPFSMPRPWAMGFWKVLGNNSFYGTTDYCVFADNSAMSTWTLMYHSLNATSAGSIRFGYQPALGSSA